MLKVIGVGDNVCDKYAHTKIMYPGGQALNFSVYAKKLGADASYLGVFGTDRVADHVIETLDLLGIEHGRCRKYQGENGYARVDLVDGDRVFLGSNKGGIVNKHPLDLTEEDLNYLRQFQLIHTSNNSHFDSQLEKVSALGVPLTYDFSYQWTDNRIVEAVAPYASCVFLSCGSVSADETKQICKKLYEKGCRRVVATRGSKGAVFYDGTEYFFQKPELVQAVDTLGAGDSFATAFLLSVTESCLYNKEEMKAGRDFYKKEIVRALKRGAAFAAETCMVEGAFGHGISFDN